MLSSSQTMPLLKTPRAVAVPEIGNRRSAARGPRPTERVKNKKAFEFRDKGRAVPERRYRSGKGGLGGVWCARVGVGVCIWEGLASSDVVGLGWGWGMTESDPVRHTSHVAHGPVITSISRALARSLDVANGDAMINERRAAAAGA